MSLKKIFSEMALCSGNFETQAAKFAADHEEKWKKRKNAKLAAN